MTDEGGLDVVVLTAERYEAPEAPGWWLRQALHEDALVVAALEAEGLRVARVAWSRAGHDWSRTRSALFRSTWDYFERDAEFTSWLDRVSSMVALINPSALVYWNKDKHYL